MSRVLNVQYIKYQIKDKNIKYQIKYNSNAFPVYYPFMTQRSHIQMSTTLTWEVENGTYS